MKKIIIFICIVFFINITYAFTHEDFYSINDTGWKAQKDYILDSFVCNDCNSSIEVQIFKGLSTNMSNDEFIQLVTPKEMRETFSQYLVKMSLYEPSKKIEIKKAEFSNIGGVKALFFTALISTDDAILENEYFAGVYKNQIFIIVLNNLDENITKNDREKVNTLYKTLIFL